MSTSTRTTIYFDYFDEVHSIINDWNENSVFKTGGLFSPEFIDENNASYSFSCSTIPKTSTYVTIVIKNGKVRLQGWTKFDKEFIRTMASTGVFITIELPIMKISLLGFWTRRKQKAEFKQLIESLGLK